MWNAAGIERSAAGLEAAARRLDQWQAIGASVHDLETANLLALARVLVEPLWLAANRAEPTSARTFPEASAGFQHSLVYSQDNGESRHNRMLIKPGSDAIHRLVRMALDEDAPWGDITSQALIPASAHVTAATGCARTGRAQWRRCLHRRHVA